TQPAPSISTVSGGCWGTWLTATPFSLTSSLAKTFLPNLAICPDLSTRTNSCNSNCAEPTICSVNALLLMRATGVRLGECTRLSVDCLRQVGPDEWAVHVPLGKLHSERLVPADPGVRQIVARILALRAVAPPSKLAKSQGMLLPSRGGP